MRLTREQFIERIDAGKGTYFGPGSCHKGSENCLRTIRISLIPLLDLAITLGIEFCRMKLDHSIQLQEVPRMIVFLLVLVALMFVFCFGGAVLLMILKEMFGDVIAHIIIAILGGLPFYGAWYILPKSTEMNIGLLVVYILAAVILLGDFIKPKRKE